MARNKKTEKEKQIGGTSRSDRATVAASAITLKSIPPYPDGFDAAQKKEWDTVCKQLIESGILIPADLPLIEAYVRELSLYKTAYHNVLKSPVVTLANKMQAASPWHKIMTQSCTTVQRLAGLLGITPRSRAQLNQYFKKNEDDGAEDPLKGL